MTDKSLLSAFEQAAKRVEVQTQIAAFNTTVGFLENTFVAAYDVADAETRQALTNAMAAFIIKTASRTPQNVQVMACFTGAVLKLTAALEKTVTDKSLIPDDFQRKLTTAALQMGARNGGSQYIVEAQNASQKIIAAARAFKVEESAAEPVTVKRLVIKKPSVD